MVWLSFVVKVIKAIKIISTSGWIILALIQHNLFLCLLSSAWISFRFRFCQGAADDFQITAFLFIFSFVIIIIMILCMNNICSIMYIVFHIIHGSCALRYCTCKFYCVSLFYCNVYSQHYIIQLQNKYWLTCIHLLGWYQYYYSFHFQWFRIFYRKA